MSINVVVSSTAAGVSVSGGTAVAISVAGSTAAAVTVGGGIGPAGFLINPGTATNAFGTFQLTAGDGITISTSAAQFQIASYGTTAVSSFAPVQSVAGRVGNVVLQASDVTAGTFAVARIPTISYTALSNVPTSFSPSAHTHGTADIVGITSVGGSFAPASHTHDASEVTSGVFDLARIPTIGYTALAGVPATFAPQAHTHSTADVVGLTASFSQVGHSHQYVQTLNGLTGTVTIAGGSGVTVSTASSSITIAAGGGSSFTGSVDGGDYTGTISYDNTITVTQQPTSQTATSGAATFSVSAISLPGGRLSYQWQRQSGGSWVAVTGGTLASLSLTGLTNAADNAAQYRVVMSSQSAASVTSNAVTLGVDPLVPGAPTSLSAVRGNSRIRLLWSAPASNGGSPITDYVVQYAVAASSFSWATFSDGTSTATEALVTGLVNQTSYVLRVAAVNAVGQGPWSAVTTPVTYGPADLVGSNSRGSIGALWAGLGESGSDLTLTDAYYSSSSNGPIATITAGYSGRINFFYVSTGSSSRSVSVLRSDGGSLDNRQSGTNFVDVVAGEGLIFEFYPAASGDRISITASLAR